MNLQVHPMIFWEQASYSRFDRGIAATSILPVTCRLMFFYHHDFYLVNFDNFGPYSLDIFIYCFTRTTVWAEFLQARQEFMLKIMHAVKNLGLDFAFPTQSIHMESLPRGLKDLTGTLPK